MLVDHCLDRRVSKNMLSFNLDDLVERFLAIDRINLEFFVNFSLRVDAIQVCATLLTGKPGL